MQVELIDRGTLRDLKKRADEFAVEAEKHLKRAAQRATSASRSRFQTGRVGRHPVPSRVRRRSTMGAFARHIRWDVRKDDAEGHSYVAFQKEELQGVAPYWLIQEIGTGNSATVLDTGERKSVKSQIGRRIAPTLVWADVDQNYQVPSGTRTEQLMSYKDVKNVPLMMDLEPQFIKREIQPKGYIREGGFRANAEYQANLLDLARRTFAKS